MSERWRLLHTLTRQEIGGLETAYAIEFLSQYPESDRGSWYAWKEGTPAWRRATECLEFAGIAGRQIVGAVPPERPGTTPVAPPAPAPSGYEYTVLTTQVIAPSAPASNVPPPPAAHVPPPPAAQAPVAQQQPQQGPAAAPVQGAPVFQQRRKYERYKCRLKVVITHEGKAFRSYTVDVSEGGLKLDKKVPWAIRDSICRVFLSAPDESERYEFEAKILSDPSDDFRIAFQSREGMDFGQKLLSWIKMMNPRAA